MCIDTYIYFLFSFSVNYEGVLPFSFSTFEEEKKLGEFKDISVQRLIFMFKIWFVNTYVLGF